MAGFYIYEHIRADTNKTFYVGKGSGNRVKSKQGRNAYWQRTVNKAGGYNTRIILRTMDEELAYLAEAERIDQCRKLGARLVNLTDGGEGMTGHKHTEEARRKISEKQRGQIRPNVSAALKGVPKSESHKKNLSLSRIGKKASAEARGKMSNTRKGRPSPMEGKKHSEETKKKIAKAMTCERNPFYGKSHSAEAMDKILAANIGRKESSETRKKKSLARQGAKNPRFGVCITEEQKAKQKEALRKTLEAKPRYQCSYCKGLFLSHVLDRWHMDKCKENK